MAEEIKEKKTTTAPKKPRAPRKPKVEVVNPEPAVEEKVPEVVETVVEEPEITTTSVELEERPEEPVSGTELPELAESFKDFSSSLAHNLVEIKKLNPNLPDGKSKWVAQVPTKTGRHILFKGSYAKAYRAAENWNISRGLSKTVKEIRSN